MEQSTKGGKRKGSGRKPTSNPKQTINFYIDRQSVNLMGGPDKLRERVYKFISDECGRSLQFPDTTVVIAPASLQSPENTLSPAYSNPDTWVSYTTGSKAYFEAELKKCTTVKEIEDVMKEVGKSSLTWPPKEYLRKLAADLGKSMYND